MELGKYARQHDMRIILETFDRSVDKMALVGPSDAAAGFHNTCSFQLSRIRIVLRHGSYAASG